MGDVAHFDEMGDVTDFRNLFGQPGKAKPLRATVRGRLPRYAEEKSHPARILP